MSDTKQFFTLKPVQEGLDLLFQAIKPTDASEMIATVDALGRILAASPQSPMNLPAFDRSAMDGYAVRAADTFGASDALPAYLTLNGQVKMGEVPQFTVSTGQAADIHTGAMIPDGADAVVMIERTQAIDNNEIEVLAPVAEGENIIRLGEDIQQGSETLPIGHIMRPQDIGGLLAVGITEITVQKRLKIAILSGGDELIDAHQNPEIGQIRDINSHMLAALCQQAGADVMRLGIAADTFESLYTLARHGFDQCDMLIISAGSSVSVRDLTSEVIASLGQPGIIQHGLAVKPGKPTILAACDAKAVIGLPGNPVSAMLVARQIILPIMHFLTGQALRPISTIAATLTQNIASTTGREDSVPVRLHPSDEGYHAEPIWGKSNLIYTLLRADGLVHVPLNMSGYTAGTLVKVINF
ncbi:MAG: gephyrin-like molybdotransferase Glp [Phototrophicaceae bacterium]